MAPEVINDLFQGTKKVTSIIELGSALFMAFDIVYAFQIIYLIMGLIHCSTEI
jgi:hypothetical protein